ncbi:hypothetical protein [Plantactinospora sp. KLBMP9567]|uniref:hypothetical protein n=1 Tax=Plantactinospora sp. KLBMP9567 TaxID=3085900 RepID=UPI002981520C|nr:hypothetical protein [Plantactinospora sp. KLBMP9567]MDW5326770.1 hypothetical protein [Plantactinospora sp. KLBMP9567]
MFRNGDQSAFDGCVQRDEVFPCAQRWEFGYPTAAQRTHHDLVPPLKVEPDYRRAEIVLIGSIFEIEV